MILIDDNEESAGDSAGDSAGNEGTLAALETRLAQLSGGLEALESREMDTQLAGFERDLLLFECDSIASRGAAQHPVMGVALGWEERLRRAGRSDDAGAIESLLAKLLIQRLRRRERAALDALEAPDEALDSSTRDRIFDALISVEELRHRVEGRAGSIGGEDTIDARAVCDEALQVLGRLREAFQRTLEIHPADAATRRSWTGRLVDFADEAILSAGERSAKLCARLLEVTGRTLQWHLDHVETERTDERRRLLRRARRVESERVEQELQAGLEKRFGTRAVELWERAILVAILGVVVLMTVDFTRGPTTWSIAIDTGLCVFLLWDFFVKAAQVRFRWSWLRRHILTDLVPALPYAWLASLEGVAAGPGQLSRLLRLVRVARVAQYLRVGLPIIRMFRAVTFLVRGLDRLVRRNARILEGEVVLFPTPEERRRARADATSPAARVWRLRGELDSLFEQRFESASPDGRTHLVEARLEALSAAACVPVAPLDSGRARSARRETLPLADAWLHRLGSVGSEEVEGRLGPEGIQRIARGARLVARSPLRFAPWLGRWAPADAADLPDRRVASRTVRAIARSLRRLHGRVLWWADLRGTLTPGEVVGRVGATLVARTARPAVRLLLFGALYLVLQLLVSLIGGGAASGTGDGTGAVTATDAGGFALFVGDLFRMVEKFVAATFVVLGSVCLAFLAVGVWLQRLARDATTFHEQVARAQFLHLTDSIKARERHADAALIGERVFRLEHRLHDPAGASESVARDETRFVRDLEAFLAKGISPPSSGAGYDPVARAVMLYSDLLDGALLAHTDTRATSQLLGNLAIQRLIRESGRVGRDLHKSLRSIDLERRRSFLRGPYLWFHSVSRALSSRSARLIVEYNAHAAPLSEMGRMESGERTRYQAWMKERADGKVEAHGVPGSAPQLTTAFTVLHFLDDSPARDTEIEQRFGAAVLARMRRDRRALVRTVFGTYPLHRLPLESRILNLRSLYSDWIEGGRILLLPLRAMWLMLVLGGRGLRSLRGAVGAIRKPEVALTDLRDAEADFAAAARKIGRMRAPGALAALHLRAVLDPEVHGLKLPFARVRSSASGSKSADDAQAERTRVGRSVAVRDALFLGAEPAYLDQIAALEVRASRNLERLERAAENGLLTRVGELLGESIENDAESLRALVILVNADDSGLRSELFGAEVLVETTLDALEFGLPVAGGLPSMRLRLRFMYWWRKLGGREQMGKAVRASGVVAVKPDAELGDVSEARRRAHEHALDRRIRRAAWRVLRADVDGVRACLDACVEGEELSGAERRAAVERRLADALRHPTRVTEQLATLRTVQTLGLVDVRNYRRQVWKLGQYAEDGDLGDVLLDLPSM